MKSKNIHWFLGMLLLVVSLRIFAQDPQFSQFYGNPVYLNPALVGNKLCPRLTLNYRNQWPSIPAAFVTYSASYDQYVEKLQGGLGFLIVADNAGNGTRTNNSISAIYAYRLDVSREAVLFAGFQGTFQQISLNWDKLEFEDKIRYGFSLETPPESLTIMFPDFSTGLMLGWRDSYYLGVGLHHLTSPDNGFYPGSGSRQHLKVTIHGGFIVDLAAPLRYDDLQMVPAITPNIIFQQQGKSRKLNLGVAYDVYPLRGGFWYQNNIDNPDAIILLFEMRHKQAKVGYTYDYTISRLSNASGGAHEVSFSWMLSCPEKKAMMRLINHP